MRRCTAVPGSVPAVVLQAMGGEDANATAGTKGAGGGCLGVAISEEGGGCLTRGFFRGN